MRAMESRFKEDDRVQIRAMGGLSPTFAGKTGTIIAVVPYPGSYDYWVRMDSGENAQFSERDLALLGDDLFHPLSSADATELDSFKGAFSVSIFLRCYLRNCANGFHDSLEPRILIYKDGGRNVSD
jgi:hypothetical protein